MTTIDNLRLAAINRHRKRLFGDELLSVYTMDPIDGESVAGTFAKDWRAWRVERTTIDLDIEEGSWQFEIAAKGDWASSQAFMLRMVSLTVGSRRWTMKKVEKPIGKSLVWKVKARLQ